ncbi:4-hydroxy-tetrahydrodipicolinate reductase [Kosmotoga sp. DU53]|uniref:4-hydroxy-tetrahydrodipicolinate reductase n=1 Tax=Kosmotoga sp. DU53 TaxID=1310160 RepID=UPI0007C551CA|nr:dihydrodipicolinate reductase C-terminal domain-containing protein [Kosmotoga sp. DU53]MDK2954491.1 4-hydroxy-tetrahydrodipicolinate reductase [Kosmotoga sp.]OAA21967.1 dihydrodipicolinate reductase [Kosmotoga sp. DU53]
MNYGLIGYTGQMGKAIQEVMTDSKLVYTRDENGRNLIKTPEVIIDFSNRSALSETIKDCREFKCGLVIGTTALTEADFELLHKLAEEVPVVQSYNFSPGINLLKLILRQFSPYMKNWDVEIVEKHHNRKKDAPSGTAIMLQKELGREAKIHSLREGGIPGDHSIIFANDGEVLELSHRAISRKVFAIGAKEAANFVLKKEKGFFSYEEVIL